MLVHVFYDGPSEFQAWTFRVPGFRLRTSHCPWAFSDECGAEALASKRWRREQPSSWTDQGAQGLAWPPEVGQNPTVRLSQFGTPGDGSERSGHWILTSVGAGRQ